MKLTEFETQLAQAHSEQQAKKILQHYLSSFKILSYAFTYYSVHIKSGRKLIFDCVSKPLSAWHKYYLEQHYADVDKTLESVNKDVLPLFWDVYAQLKIAKNNREKRLRQESIKYGINQGLSIPVYGPNQDFATLTLHQRKSESCLMNYKRYQFEWLSAAQIFYHYIKKILNLYNPPLVTNRLTKRELQCLSFTAQSWRVEEIAAELKISPRTVNFHIQNANKKLGVNNKYQACYLLDPGRGW